MARRRSYRVKVGDDLISIANKLNTTTQQLLTSNPTITQITPGVTLTTAGTTSNPYWNPNLINPETEKYKGTGTSTSTTPPYWQPTYVTPETEKYKGTSTKKDTTTPPYWQGTYVTPETEKYKGTPPPPPPQPVQTPIVKYTGAPAQEAPLPIVKYTGATAATPYTSAYAQPAYPAPPATHYTQSIAGSIPGTSGAPLTPAASITPFAFTPYFLSLYNRLQNTPRPWINAPADSYAERLGYADWFLDKVGPIKQYTSDYANRFGGWIRQAPGQVDRLLQGTTPYMGGREAQLRMAQYDPTGTFTPRPDLAQGIQQPERFGYPLVRLQLRSGEPGHLVAAGNTEQLARSIEMSFKRGEYPNVIPDKVVKMLGWDAIDPETGKSYMELMGYEYNDLGFWVGAPMETGAPQVTGAAQPYYGGGYPYYPRTRYGGGGGRGRGGGGYSYPSRLPREGGYSYPSRAPSQPFTYPQRFTQMEQEGRTPQLINSRPGRFGVVTWRI